MRIFKKLPIPECLPSASISQLRVQHRASIRGDCAKGISPASFRISKKGEDTREKRSTEKERDLVILGL